MKVSGSEVAKAMAAKKKNMEMANEGHVVERDQEESGSHIKAMMSFIEAIHHKDPEAAHMHITDYARKAAMMDQEKEM